MKRGVKPMRGRLLVAVILGAIVASVVSQPAHALPLVYTQGSGDLSATVTFSTLGTSLLVTLTNDSTADVLVPTDVLTAVFFTVAGDPTLTPVSALLSGSSVVVFGPNGGGNVGGEWAYADGLSGAPGGGDEGISSAGFGLFGAGNFGGSNLDEPEAVNGLNYGLTSAGDNTASGNAAVTGNVPLIKNSVIFTLTGLPTNFDPSVGISNVVFQYGTQIPEPATLVLLGSGLMALGLLGRKRLLTGIKN